MSFKNILKIFFLDWIITVVMYLVGLLITGIKDLKSVDIVFYLSNVSSSPTGTSPLLNVLTYLMASFGFVILISFLVNKSSLKIPMKEFIISQFVYIFSTVLIIFAFLLLI